jgi:hypothetical protein
LCVAAGSLQYNITASESQYRKAISANAAATDSAFSITSSQSKILMYCSISFFLFLCAARVYIDFNVYTKAAAAERRRRRMNIRWKWRREQQAEGN